MPAVTPTCLCPQDSKIQILAKIANNLVNLLNQMSSGVFTGQFVNLGACLCSEAQILAAINNNLVNAFAVIGTGVPDTIHERTNNAGDETIIPLSAHHVEIINVGGAARTSLFVLSLASASVGHRLQLRFKPTGATPNIVIEVRNDTGGGTLIYTYATDGSGSDTFVADLYYSGAAWQPYSNAVPVV